MSRRKRIFPIKEYDTATGALIRNTMGRFRTVAIARCNKLTTDTVNVMTRFDYTVAEVIPWFVKPEYRALLEKAYNLAETPSYVTASVPEDCDLHFQFQGIEMLTPSPACMIFDKTLGAPLADFIKEVRAIHADWAVVKYVVNWLDKFATPGAIRYYFPSIMALAPEWDGISEDTAKRFVDPIGVAKMMPLFRDAASTVASAQLLPAVVPLKNHKGLTLYLDSSVIVRHDVPIDAETQQFFI
jgi:hypothetical protein